MNSVSSILVGQIGNAFWLRVEGNGCFQNSLSMKNAVEARITDGVRQFVVDLERCPMMDSTFLGTLKGIARELRSGGGGTVSIINVNTRNEQLICNLGLNHLVEMDLSGSSWTEERRQAAAALSQCAAACACKDTQAEHVLVAHQTLCEDNPENAARFRDVIEFLECEKARRQAAGAAVETKN